MTAKPLPSILVFFNEMAVLHQRILAARENGDWDEVGSLVDAREALIKEHDSQLYQPPSSTEKQRILEICQMIQQAESPLLEEATVWRDQIQRFILKN